MLARKYIFFILVFIIVSSIYLASLAFAFNPDVFNDTDLDGLTDYQEKTIYLTSWDNKDSDNDGFNDGTEVANDYSPKHKGLKMVDADTDNDGLNDEWEIKLGSNLMLPDTDGDGYLDGDEVYNGYSPTDPEPIKYEKKIEVDIANFNLKYSFAGIVLDEFKVSTGKPSTPTPTGEFEVMGKFDTKFYYSYPDTPWNLQFTRKNGLNYYIHTAYWHNKFGIENVSGGCVNVPQEKMNRLYHWANEGTKVIIK